MHEQLAACLWEASSDADAVLALTRLAESGALERAAAEAAQGRAQEAKDDELANIPRDEKKERRGGGRRRKWEEKPKRTEEEIAALRAERAKKRALTGAPPHHDGARR